MKGDTRRGQRGDDDDGVVVDLSLGSSPDPMRMEMPPTTQDIDFGVDIDVLPEQKGINDAQTAVVPPKDNVCLSFPFHLLSFSPPFLLLLLLL